MSSGSSQHEISPSLHLTVYVPVLARQHQGRVSHQDLVESYLGDPLLIIDAFEINQCIAVFVNPCHAPQRILRHFFRFLSAELEKHCQDPVVEAVAGCVVAVAAGVAVAFTVPVVILFLQARGKHRNRFHFATLLDLIRVSRIGASLQHRAQTGRESEVCTMKQESVLAVVCDNRVLH